MQISDVDKFRTLMTGMFEYYDKQPTTVLMDLYWGALRHWTFEEFEVAAGKLVRVSSFMPRIDAFERLRTEAINDTAGEVFAGIRQWLQYSPNGYTTKSGTPRDIASAIGACGGANAIAMCTFDGLPFLEKRFTEHYKQIASRTEARELLPNLSRELIGFDNEDEDD